VGIYSNNWFEIIIFKSKGAMMKSTVFKFGVFFIFITTQLSAQGNFFDQVDYKGAFGSTDWTQGWTGLYHYGVTGEAATAQDVITVSDADISSGSSVYWTADHTYLLDGRVFVDDGAVLHIEAGTVVKGKPGTGENASALIVARGGKIYAEGTADRPIIFTAEADDISNPSDLAYDLNGQWGGVIILGKAKINRPAGEFNIEGIPTTEPRGMYGGTDDDDNSGVLRYLSIRHGGAEIGEGNEINGLTLGGVGRGTTIDHIEVLSNFDDGFEWFGGTVNCKYLIAAFCGDDGIDFDEGYRGRMQYVFVLQHPDRGNRCGEHDGAPASAVTTEPKAHPLIYNATYLGSGMNSGNADQDELFKMRENFGGEYKNSIFGDYNGYGASIEGTYSPDDAKDRLANGGLVIQNNIWFNLGQDSLGKESWSENYLRDAANGNVEEDPQLASIDRGQNGLLDPRPSTSGPAWKNLAEYPVVTAIESPNFTRNQVPDTYALGQNYPNPFNPSTTIEFVLPGNSIIDLSIYNILGQKVITLINGMRMAGSYSVQFNAGNLASGWYIYRLQTVEKVISRKMLLIK
jgi:hypothetical protein